MPISNLNTVGIVILAIAVASVGIGIWLMLSTKKLKEDSSPNATSAVAWLLLSIGAVLILFLFFPSTEIKGTLLGVSATGAAALFLVVWWFGSKRAMDAIAQDKRLADLLSEHKRVKQPAGDDRSKQQGTAASISACKLPHLPR